MPSNNHQAHKLSLIQKSLIIFEKELVYVPDDCY